MERQDGTPANFIILRVRFGLIFDRFLSMLASFPGRVGVPPGTLGTPGGSRDDVSLILDGFWDVPGETWRHPGAHFSALERSQDALE